jgi:nucleoside-diphosphate-sugar epimerase
MKKLYLSHDVILPLAGLVGAPVCDRHKAQAWSTNFKVIDDMYKVIKNSDKKIIYPCTNSGYGSRPDGKPVTESDELTPISVYGRSKIAAERIVLENGGISLRLATVMGYSPCMRLDLLVNTFVWKALKERSIVLFEKNFKRNYINIQDVAKAFTLLLSRYNEYKGEAFNVGLSSANLSKLELAQRVKLYVPECHIIEAPFMSDPDKRDYVVSNKKIESIGFKPEFSLDQTIKELVCFYSTVDLDSANIFFENW